MNHTDTGTYKSVCGLLAPAFVALLLSGVSCGAPAGAVSIAASPTSVDSAGTVTLTVSTAQLEGRDIQDVGFFLNGSDNPVYQTSISSPEFVWHVSPETVENGAHEWQAIAYDSQRNRWRSNVVTVTVDIGGAPVDPPGPGHGGSGGPPALVGLVPSAGTARSVALREELVDGLQKRIAYVVSDEFGLGTFDVTHAHAPVALGTSTPAFKGGFDISVDGSHALVAAGSNGLHIVDVADLGRPTPVGWIDIEARGTAIAGHRGYVRVSVPGNPAHTDLVIIDLSTPSAPVILSQLFLPSSDAVEVVGTKAYVTAGGALHVIDVSNPESPQNIASLPIPNGARELAVSGNQAYVGNLSGVYAVNVSNPSGPWITGSLNGGTFGLGATNGAVYSVGGGLRSIGTTNPASLSLMGTVDDYFSQGVAVLGELAVLASPNVDVANGEGGLYLFDLAAPAQPQLRAHVAAGSGGNFGVATSGTIAVTAAGAAGLHVSDIADASHPTPIGWLEGNVRGVAALDEFAYARIAVPGNPAHTDLAVVDLRTPSDPQIVAQVFLPGGDAVVAIGSCAYVATGAQLRIFDVSNPFSPQSVGSVAIPDGALALSVSSEHAFVGNYSGVHMVDISNPTAPQVVGTLSGLTFGLASSGDRMYSVGGGLRIVDVSDPTDPTLLSTVPDFSAMAVGVVDNLVFIASPSDDAGVFVYDVADGTAPELLTSIAVPGPARSVSTTETFVFVGDDTSTVNIIGVAP